MTSGVGVGPRLAPNEDIERDDREVVYGEPVPDALDRRPEASNQRLHLHAEESRYTSPLPSPDDLARYNELIPDGAERLLAVGEREQAHRHEIERRLVSLDEKGMPEFYDGQRRGHYVSLALGIGYEAVMVVVVLAGAPIAGVAGAAVGIGAMVWAVRRDTDSTSKPEPIETKPAAEDDE